MSIPAPTRRVHECDLPYPYLFVEELADYTPPTYDPPLPEDADSEVYVGQGKSISIDNPRYEDGRLVQCPACKTWWVFRTHPTYPGPNPHTGMVQCITTFKPRWHLVRWRDFDLRRRIREAEEAGDVGPFPPPPVIPKARRPLKAPRTF